jgi:FkbM family methyltransferase
MELQEARDLVPLTKIDHLLAQPRMHDADYAIFSHFQDPGSTVIDVGADWGYSAPSIWAAGAQCAVLSVEVMSWYRGHLEQIRDRFPGRYDFVLVGAGTARAEFRFVTPVLNGRVLTALTSADEVGHRRSLAKNIDDLANGVKLALSPFDLRFIVTAAEVDRLDNVLANYKGPVPLQRLVAIKIDAEGMEPAVLAGTEGTLARHRPLLMIESAGRKGVRDALSGRGYRFAVRGTGSRLAFAEQASGVNGFYVHETREAEYRSSGLLA